MMVVDSFSVREVISCQCHYEGQMRLCWVTGGGGGEGGVAWGGGRTQWLGDVGRTQHSKHSSVYENPACGLHI